ncbi:MAG: hypothetical protein ABSF70_06540 [Terracidiphilus sp.]|jgi:hypothetical protein
MNPNGIYASAQTSPSARRPKAFALYWRLAVIVVIAFSILFCVSFVSFKLLYPHGMTTQNKIHDAVLMVSFFMAFAGKDILKRAGYKKFPMRYISCAAVFSVTPIFLLFLPLPQQVKHIVGEYGPYLFYALIAGMLPLSLYLKHRKKKSNTESAVANAS